MKKKLSLLMVALVAIAAFAVQATRRAPVASTSTLTFSEKCNGAGTADDGVQWTVTSDGEESNFDNAKGIHYGTSSKAVQYIKLNTTDISGTITKVVVNASTANGVTATVDVKVGDAAFGGEAQSLSTSAADYTFEGSATGAIEVTVTKQESAVKALYVKSVVVTYEAEAPAVEKPTLSLQTGSYVGPQSVTITCATEGASIYYTTDGTEPTAASTPYTAAISVAETTTISAIAIKGEDKSAVATATLTILEKIANTQATAYTVAQALAMKDKDAAVLAHADNKVYVTGVVEEITEISTEHGNATYTITDGENAMKVYRGNYLDGAAFSDENKDNLVAGKLAVVYGTLSVYNDAVQFAAGNNLVRLAAISTITVAAGIENGTVEVDKTTAAEGDEVTITATPAEGYKLLSISVKNGEEDVAVSGGKFTMPAGNVTVSATFVQPEDITIAPTEGDIYAALKAATTDAGKIAKNITINLTKDVEYTLSGTIKGAANITINGNGATIDASTGDNIIGIEGVEEFAKNSDETNSDHSFVSAITFKDVTIKGMKKALVRDLMTKTLLETLTIDNCVMQVSDAKPFIDFDSRGYVGKVVVKNSTIWAAAGTNKNFAKYGSRPLGISNAALTQEFDIQNSTIVNIGSKADFSGGQNFNNLKQVGTAQNVYTVKNNIFVNCGKSGQAIVGLNNGQTSATPSWDVDKNAFNWNGADVAATEVTKAGKKNEEDIVKNSIPGVVAFASETAIADGNFKLANCAQNTAHIGDPRWLDATVEPEPEDIVISPASGDITAALFEATTAINKKAKNITINLAENGAYTVSAPIEGGASIVINGNGATIDASGLTDAESKALPLILLDGSSVHAKNADGTDNAKYMSVDAVTISKVTINGLAHALVKDAQNTLVNKISIDESVIELSGANNVFDFNNQRGILVGENTEKKGYPAELSITNSTLWSKTNHSGYFLQTNGRVKDLDNAQTTFTQTINIANSTLYKISNNQHFNNLSGKGQQSLHLNMAQVILVDCGKQDFLRGWQGGQQIANENFKYNQNTYWWNGADNSAKMTTGNGCDASGTVLTTDPAFKDAANGDFTVNAGSQQAKLQTGDVTHWPVTYDPTLDPAVLWYSATPVAASWGSADIKVEAEKLANVKVGDILHVAVEIATPGGLWDAQVVLKDGSFADLEGGVPCGDGSVTDATFVVTGDILARIQATGLLASGVGYSTTMVSLEAGTATGSDASIWVGNSNTYVSVNAKHFLNANGGHYETINEQLTWVGGVEAGDIIRVTCTEAAGVEEDNRYIIAQYSGNDTGWQWTDYENMPAVKTATGFVFVVPESNVAELKTDGIIINQKGYNITQVELVKSQVVDVELALETGAVINEVLDAKKTEIVAAGDKVGNITINLAENGAYTVSASIEAGGNVIINGNGSKIDASSLTKPFIQMSATPAVAPVMNGDAVVSYPVEIVSIKDVSITGVSAQLFYENMTRYFIKKFEVDNVVVGGTSSSKPVIDFSGGGQSGNFEALSINNSTIYFTGTHSQSFLSTQQAKKVVAELGGTTQTTKITNSTFNNVATGKNFGTQIQNNQSFMTFDIENNIFVNCGKKGQVLRGLGGNASSAQTSATWTVANNIFNHSGENAEEGVVGSYADVSSMTSIAGLMTFTNAAAGDFNGSFLLAPGTEAPATMPGDPRWTLTTATSYAITIGEVKNGTMTASAAYAAAGDKIYPTMTPAEGYAIYKLPVVKNDAGEDVTASITFGQDEKGVYLLMPAFNITVSYEFSKLYDITLPTETTYGTVTLVNGDGEAIADTKFVAGKEIKIKVANLAADYKVVAMNGETEITLNPGDGTKFDYYFTMPEGDVAISIVSATGINSIAADKMMKDATIYNMKGQRVDKAQKGLYIINGKKVVVK